MLSQCFFWHGIKPPLACISLNVTVPQPGTNLGNLFIRKLFDGAFDFLDGAHSQDCSPSELVRKPQFPATNTDKKSRSHIRVIREIRSRKLLRLNASLTPNDGTDQRYPDWKLT
jgi:hypothetical protein